MASAARAVGALSPMGVTRLLGCTAAPAIPRLPCDPPCAHAHARALPLHTPRPHRPTLSPPLPPAHAHTPSTPPFQIGKAVGHSHMLGDPLGAITTVTEGVTGFVRAVGRGFSTGQTEHFVDGSRMLMGGVVGGLAGAGARVTTSLHSVFHRILREAETAAAASAAGRLPGGGGAADTTAEYRNPQGKDALLTLGRGLRGLVHKPLRGAQQRGPLGLAQGVADGVWGMAAATVSAPLQAGSFVFASVERAAMENIRGSAGGHDLLRPARSFFADGRLLPLARCMMASFEVKVQAGMPPRHCATPPTHIHGRSPCAYSHHHCSLHTHSATIHTVRAMRTVFTSAAWPTTFTQSCGLLRNVYNTARTFTPSIPHVHTHSAAPLR